MGNCVGGANAPDNVFKVININDNKSVVQKGLMEVTATELIYVDGRSKEDWHWPLKFLRKYGCDGDVFTFEAGRKCPGGEGLYAFETKKANVLFDMVARNINQGDMSPAPDSAAAETSVMNFPTRRTSTTSPIPRDQPSYTNLDLMGNPLQNSDHTPSDAVTPPDPTKYVYREVVFDRPADDHPRPSAEPKKNPSYTQIDFDKTVQYNEQRMKGTAALTSSATTPHGRTSSISTGESISPTKRTRRPRMHTYGGRDRHGSRSESSFSSQSSLTESSRDVRSPLKPPNGATPHSDSSMYQNVEQQYQNVQLGTGEVGQVFETLSPLQPQQQPNYCNVSLTSGGSSSSAVPGPMEMGAGHESIIKENGDTMTTYAQLELSSEGHKNKRSMSSSDTTRDPAHQQYTQLDFPVGDISASSSATGDGGVALHGRRSASVSGTLPSTASGIGSNHVSRGPAQQKIIEEGLAQISGPAHGTGVVMDETKVTYGVLNFSQMDALTELAIQREKELELEKHQREEREKANTQGKKKGK